MIVLERPKSSPNMISRFNFNLLAIQVSKLAKQVQIVSKSWQSSSKVSSEQVWKKKHITSCKVAQLAFKDWNDFVWYLDSVCSKHMCEDKNLFTKLKDYKARVVTFGDGSKATIIGKASIILPCCPIFEDVLYVVGLKANLLSISQIDC